MVLHGHVRNGIIVADNPVDLPEGASVRIEFIGGNPLSLDAKQIPRRGGQYAGQIWLAPDFDKWPTDIQESLGMSP